MDIFVSFCVFGLTSVYAEISIDSQERTWLEASRHCKLATPPLYFDKDRITVNPGVNDADDVWIGYYQTRIAFEYFGCALKSQLGEPTHKTMGDPGLCLSACRTTMDTVDTIGVYDKECFCLNKSIIHSDYFETSCNKHCPNFDGVVCGGNSGGTKYVSLYKTVKTGKEDLDPDKEEKACMWFNGAGQDLHWSICTDISVVWRIICQNGGNVWLHTSGYGSWQQSTVRCFGNSSRPSSFDKASTFVTEAPDQMWTGVIRSSVILDMHGVEPSSLPSHIKYGYVDKQDTRYEVKFTDNEDGKSSLCLQDSGNIEGTETTTGTTKQSSGTPAMTETSTRANGNTVTSTGSSGVTSVLPTSSSTTQPLVSGPFADEQEQTGSDSTNLGLIVGLTVSVVIIILVTIAIVIIRKRGVRLPFQKKEEPRKEPLSRPPGAITPDAISRPISITHCSYNNSPNEYAEIGLTSSTKSSYQATIKNAEKSGSHHDYLVLEKAEEGEYDTTRTSNTTHDNLAFNPYNKLDTDMTSSYDHIGNGISHLGAKVTNNDYGVGMTDGTYNTTSSVSYDGMNYDACEDVPNDPYSFAEEPDSFDHAHDDESDDKNHYDAI